MNKLLYDEIAQSIGTRLFEIEHLGDGKAKKGKRTEVWNLTNDICWALKRDDPTDFVRQQFYKRIHEVEQELTRKKMEENAKRNV